MLPILGRSHYIITLFLSVQLSMLVPAFAGEVPVPTGRHPADVVLEYHKACRRIDWPLAAQLSHPGFLKGFKEKILNILGRTEAKDQEALLNEFGVAKLSDLEAMSFTDFYVAANHRRGAVLTAKQREDYQRAEIDILETRPLDDERCVVRFQSQVPVGDRTVKKDYQYLVRKHDGQWKIDLSDLVSATGNKTDKGK